jgi:hypothetical protein
VYDFQPISVGQLGLAPTVSRHDIEIELDRDSVSLHAQVFDESAQRDGSVELVIVTVDDDLHVD